MSIAVVWQLKAIGQDRERPALWLISSAFFALVLYVLIQVGRSILLRIHPETSAIGISWLAATLLMLLTLSLQVVELLGSSPSYVSFAYFLYSYIMLLIFEHEGVKHDADEYY